MPIRGRPDRSGVVVSRRRMRALKRSGCTLLRHATRPPTDLQVGTGQFISYQDLLRLPQVSFTTRMTLIFLLPRMSVAFLSIS